jgi:hypothetical protein
VRIASIWRFTAVIRPFHDVAKHARLRITPAFARWALQIRSIVERGRVPAAGYEDHRPVRGEMLITQQWACGRDQSSPIATRSD